jgi:hypothetical protein
MRCKKSSYAQAQPYGEWLERASDSSLRPENAE